MIDAKQAVAVALTYFRTLFAADVLADIQLEEIELSDDSRFWTVTLSALLAREETNGSVASALAQALGTHQDRQRLYKVFTINAENAQVKSMKIRPTP